MKQEERLEDQEEALRIMLEGFQAEIWTALPCIVESFDAETQTCSLQPTIQGTQVDQEGAVTFVNMPLLVNVPVYRLRGGGFSVTVPIVKDDEGLVILASRCIDNWWQNGGIQQPFEQRLHDLSDGFFLPGFNSQKKNLASFATDAVEVRNDAGDVKVSVKVDQIVLTGKNSTVTVKQDEIDIVATTVKITGDLAVSGKLTSGDTTGLAGGAKKVVLDGDPVSGGFVHASSTKTTAT